MKKCKKKCLHFQVEKVYLMGRCALGLIVSGFGGLPHCEMRKSGGTGDSLVCDAADAEAYCFS